MSLWFEIILTFFLPILFFMVLVLVKKLNHIININNGIFKQNNKIYQHIFMSGLLNVGEKMFETGKKIIKERKKKKNETD